MELYDGILTPFEMAELIEFPCIYTIGRLRVNSCDQVSKNNRYNAQIGEQIGYRYIVESALDAGAFGSVFKCIDKKTNQYVAIKISSDKREETLNAKVEARLLKQISFSGSKELISMLDHFKFRYFYVIVFELLHTNLYKQIKLTLR